MQHVSTLMGHLQAKLSAKSSTSSSNTAAKYFNCPNVTVRFKALLWCVCISLCLGKDYLTAVSRSMVFSPRHLTASPTALRGDTANNGSPRV
jgi:hypothetical protein